MSGFGMFRGLVWVAAVTFGVCASVIAVAAPPSDNDPYAAVLVRQGIAPDAAGITAYLSGLRPTVENRKHVAALIVQLGDNDYAVRDLATRQLIALPVVPAADLRAAAQGEDGEVRLRAAQVIAARSVGNATSAVTVACFRTITRRKLPGAAPAILDVLPLYVEEQVLAAGREALKVTSRPQDAALLRETARGAGAAVEARVAAVGALPSLLGAAARPDLAALLSEPESRVKLAAARALADQGDRASLAALIELLSARDVRVRGSSAATLRALTGRASDYVAWLEPEAQADAIRGWQQWLAKESATARLTYPLRPANFELGRTLMCLYAKNEVIELDATGRQTFSTSEPNGCPWACQGLPTGGRLVAMYTANVLVEYQPDGKERSRFAVPGGPMSVQRLENGNTLLACNNANKVVEVDDAGKIVWEVAMAGGPSDAVRLDNGHTLVTVQNTNSVVEIDPAGKEVWKIQGLHTPRSASRLENGNTLVCDLGVGKVVEFDAAGAEVWSQKGFASPFSAQRLSTGTTLVADTQGVKEIDREGKVVSENKQQSLGRVHRY